MAYIFNSQKSKAFLYTNNEISETEIRGKNPICSAKNKKNKLSKNKLSLTKDIIDLYSENYTTLKDKIKEDTNKWKHIPHS